MDTYVITKDPIWHHFVDGLVMLAIGFVVGVMLTGSMMSYEITTIETKTIRRAPTLQVPSTEPGNVVAPQNSVRIDEI